MVSSLAGSGRRSLQVPQPSGHVLPIPARPVLLSQQKELSIGAGAGVESRGMQMEKRHERVGLWPGNRGMSKQKRAQSHRFLADVTAQQRIACVRGMSF